MQPNLEDIGTADEILLGGWRGSGLVVARSQENVVVNVNILEADVT